VASAAVETCQDVLQIKAVCRASRPPSALRGQRRPLMVSVTMETTGTMLVGSDIVLLVCDFLEPFRLETFSGPNFAGHRP